MNPRAREVFFEIHSGLHREAPGDSGSTEKAFSMMAGLAAHPVVTDIGCGPGGQTLDIARLSGGQIIGVDMNMPYLIELKRRATASNSS